MRLDSRLLVMCGALLLIAAEVPPALQRNDAPVFDINVTISPVARDQFQLLRSAKPGKYRCFALIHDEPGSRRVWGPKEIILGPGETREASVEYAGLKATLKATISLDLTNAKTAVTIMRGDKIISRQLATVTLLKNRSS